MSMPEGNLVATVERMARALEPLAAAATVRTALEEEVRAAVAALAADHGSVSWVDAEGTLHTWATPGLSEEAASAYAALLMRAPAWSQQWPRPLIMEGLDEDLDEGLGPDALLEGEPTLREQLGMKSLVALPLGLSEGSRVGVIVGWFRAPHRPTEEEVRHAWLYARLAAVALGQRRMLEEGQRAVARARAEAQQAEVLRLSRFQAVTEGFSRALTRREVARVVLELGLPAVGAVAGAVHLLAPEGRDVELAAAVGLDPQLEEELRRLPRDGHMPGYDAARTRAPVWLESPQALRVHYPELAAKPGMAAYHALAFLPVLAEGKVLGVIAFAFGAPRHFCLAEQTSIVGLARQCGLALERSLLYERERAARLQEEAAGRRLRAAEEESRRSAARLHLLVRVSQLLSEAGLDLEQVLEVLGRAVTQEVGDGCLIQLVSEEGQFLELAAVHHPDPKARALLEQVVRVRRLRVGEGLQGAAVSTGQTLFLRAMSAQALEGVGPEAALRPYFEQRGPQDVIAVPLVARGHACGSLLVVRDASGRPYGPDDQVMLESIASRAALAIEDARLYAAALQALRLRDDFLSVAGHELKNPLNALQLQLRILARKAREHQLSDSLAERAERVARTGERLGLLIEDLLDVSRINAGQLQLQCGEVDLTAMAQEVISRMAEELSRADCEALLESERTVEGCWDRLRLEQVLMNLLSNACKYGRKRPIRVRVEVAQGLARLSVQDEGYGIAPEDQERIFQRFQRAEATRHIQGLGLGLWICRQIAEAHGGTLRVESELGKGSTFILELPHSVCGSSPR
jgi:signal transduction histidine kinase